MLQENEVYLEKEGKMGDWCFIKNDEYILIQYGDNSFLDLVYIPINTLDKNNWKWNGSKEFPSLEESVLIKAEIPIHFYLVEGKILFL